MAWVVAIIYGALVAAAFQTDGIGGALSLGMAVGALALASASTSRAAGSPVGVT